jgi:hypothetical protein
MKQYIFLGLLIVVLATIAGVAAATSASVPVSGKVPLTATLIIVPDYTVNFGSVMPPATPVDITHSFDVTTNSGNWYVTAADSKSSHIGYLCTDNNGLTPCLGNKLQVEQWLTSSTNQYVPMDIVQTIYISSFNSPVVPVTHFEKTLGFQQQFVQPDTPGQYTMSVTVTLTYT